MYLKTRSVLAIGPRRSNSAPRGLSQISRWMRCQFNWGRSDQKEATVSEPRVDHRRSQKCTRCRRRERSDHCGRPRLSSDRLDSRTTCWQGVPHGRRGLSLSPQKQLVKLMYSLEIKGHKAAAPSEVTARRTNLGTRANARSGERARLYGPEHGRGRGWPGE